MIFRYDVRITLCILQSKLLQWSSICCLMKYSTLTYCNFINQALCPNKTGACHGKCFVLISQNTTHTPCVNLYLKSYLVQHYECYYCYNGFSIPRSITSNTSKSDEGIHSTSCQRIEKHFTYKYVCEVLVLYL